MGIEAMSGLSFFSVTKYRYKKENECDFSNIPRPHFCMGLLQSGRAVFTAEDGKRINLLPGDIIFVPISSRYVSHWYGSPDIAYISFHFAFRGNGGLSENNRFDLQKVHLPDFGQLQEIFSYAADRYNGDDSEQCQVLSLFFGLLSRVLPLLTCRQKHDNDAAMARVTEYMNLHCEENTRVDVLAESVGMSVPNFYVRFRKYTGMSPIAYKNRIRINRAVRLLKSNKPLSVEEISSLLGFESAAYFRRVFKQETGEAPTAFRKNKLEL